VILTLAVYFLLPVLWDIEIDSFPGVFIQSEVD
jgi:hypothetical protein